MKTNNIIPSVVTKAARKATRIVTNGNTTLSYLKALAHRMYRRELKQKLNQIKYFDDTEDFDDTPSFIADSRNVC